MTRTTTFLYEKLFFGIKMTNESASNLQKDPVRVKFKEF